MGSARYTVKIKFKDIYHVFSLQSIFRNCSVSASPEAYNKYRHNGHK